MKRYKLLKDLFDHKAGEILSRKEIVYSVGLVHGSEKFVSISTPELDLYTRLGVLEEVDENVRWKPKMGEQFYFVSSWGEINCGVWDNVDFDENIYDFGNCFKTKEEAEAFRDKIKGLSK